MHSTRGLRLYSNLLHLFLITCPDKQVRPKVSKTLFVVRCHEAAALYLSSTALEDELVSRLLGDCCYVTTENTIQLQIQVQLQLFTLHNTMSSALVWCLINAQKQLEARGQKSKRDSCIIKCIDSGCLNALFQLNTQEKRKSSAPFWLRRGNSSTEKIWQRHVCLSIHKNAKCAVSRAADMHANTHTHTFGSVLACEPFAAG